VSQQVIRAERILGRPSLRPHARRHGRRRPSAEALSLLRAGFADLAAAVARAAHDRDESLTVSVAPILAARWLIWRLPRFRAAHPGIRVRIDAELGLVDPGWGEVDLCVRVGRGNWPDVRAERLAPQVIFPVCAPEMARLIADHADLARVPIIRETKANFGWEDWLGPEGRPEVVPGDGPLFSDAQLCLDAAISGEGVFLSFESLAATLSPAASWPSPSGGATPRATRTGSSAPPRGLCGAPYARSRTGSGPSSRPRASAPRIRRARRLPRSRARRPSRGASRRWRGRGPA
jgi:DNA-binding transcriptional LysR family regulator